MGSKLLFMLIVLGVAAVALLLAYRSPARVVRKLKANKNITVGIVVFTLGLSLLVLAMPSRSDTYFAYSEVYLGLDYTRKVSPQCYRGGDDDRATSNGGFRQNLYVSTDERLHVNAKYTHHSCAFNEDRYQYDAFGIEISYRTDCVLLFLCIDR